MVGAVNSNPLTLPQDPGGAGADPGAGGAGGDEDRQQAGAELPVRHHAGRGCPSAAVVHPLHHHRVPHLAAAAAEEVPELLPPAGRAQCWRPHAPQQEQRWGPKAGFTLGATTWLVRRASSAWAARDTHNCSHSFNIIERASLFSYHLDTRRKNGYYSY